MIQYTKDHKQEALSSFSSNRVCSWLQRLSFSNQQVSGRVFKARNIQVFLRGTKATQVQRSVLYKAFKIIAPNASKCNLYALDSPRNANDAN